MFSTFISFLYRFLHQSGNRGYNPPHFCKCTLIWASMSPYPIEKPTLAQHKLRAWNKKSQNQRSSWTRKYKHKQLVLEDDLLALKVMAAPLYNNFKQPKMGRYDTTDPLDHLRTLVDLRLQASKIQLYVGRLFPL